MAERIVQKWLTEYKSLSGSEIPCFCGKIKDDIQLIKSIFDILQQPHSHVHLQESVCGQLYEFYRSGDFELKRFCLQFVPAVIWNYLHSLAIHQNCSRAGSLLLGIYNMEAVDADGISRVESFTVPTLAKPSIYHEPVSQLALTENVLSYQQSDHRIITRGPSSQLNELTIQNRFNVLTHVLSQYNADIGFLSPVSHAFFSQICSRLVLCGFSEVQQTGKLQSAKRDPKSKFNLDIHKNPRIPLDSVFMLEMLTGIYFVISAFTRPYKNVVQCLLDPEDNIGKPARGRYIVVRFNGQATAGMQAVDDIHFRASYEIYADVLLVANAIKHSLDTNPSGRPSDGPVGINVAITPPSPVVKRSAITNASFKIRRQKETTITVTIEGVEKTDTAAQQENNDEEANTPAISVKQSSHDGNKPVHAGKCIDTVDVAINDQSGTKVIETVEMEEVKISTNGKELKQTNKETNIRKYQESNPSRCVDGLRISPASHSREIHQSNNQQSSSSSRESIETNL